jgi:hypothetical protein
MSMFKRLRLRGILAVGFAGLLSIFLFSAGSVLAAPAASQTDPIVVVVRDITPSNCTLTLTSRNLVGQAHQTRTVIHCPAGTLLTVLHVPQSQAIARHEAHVVLPSASSSQAQQAQAGKQIDALVAATIARLQPSPASKPTSPLASCTLRQQTGGGGVNWTENGKTNSYSSHVTWDTNGDCSITIINSHLQGTQSQFASYWGSDKYNQWEGQRGCIFVGTNNLSWDPGHRDSPGFHYMQVLWDGSHCFSAFDNSFTIIVAKLND